jgi:hypothetical protein
MFSMNRRNIGTTPAPKLEPPAASIPRDAQISVAEVRLSKDIIDGPYIAVHMDRSEQGDQAQNERLTGHDNRATIRTVMDKRRRF